MVGLGISHDPSAYGDLINYGTQWLVAVISFVACMGFAYADWYAPTQWYRKYVGHDGSRLMPSDVFLGKIGRFLFCLAVAFQYSFGTGTIIGRVFIIVGILWVAMGTIYVGIGERSKRHAIAQLHKLRNKLNDAQGQ